MKPIILIIGRPSGFIATYAMRHYGDRASLSDNTATEAQLTELFNGAKFELVINAAARTDTHALERGEGLDEARWANVELPKLLAKRCDDTGAKLIHFSTGMMHEVYDERFARSENVSPTCKRLCEYTKQKLDAEYWLIDSGIVRQKTCTVLRIHQPFAGFHHPKNLLTKMWQQRWSKFLNEPSSLTSLDNCFTVIDKLFADYESTGGLFHLVNNGTITHLEIARRLQGAGLLDPTIKLSKLNRRAYDQKIAKNRGAYQPQVVLRSKRLEEYGISLEPISSAIDSAIEQLAATVVAA